MKQPLKDIKINWVRDFKVKTTPQNFSSIRFNSAAGEFLEIRIMLIFW